MIKSVITDWAFDGQFVWGMSPALITASELEVIKDEVHGLCSSSDIAKHLQLCLLVNGLPHQSREAFLWTQLTLPLLAEYLRELEPTQPPEKGIVI